MAIDPNIRSQTQDCVVTDRGGVIENRHFVHAAVVDSTGKLLFAVGDPSRVTLARSAAKPVQALGVLETGAVDRFGFDEADLALMCASHNSEDRHIARAREMLAKAGVKEEDLVCSPHPPLSEAVGRAWIKGDFKPTGLCSNCSGKHAGMLAGAKALDAGLKDYDSQGHPLQMRIKALIDELCGLDEDGVESQWSIDGCNLPAPAFPLHYLGRMYAVLAAASDVKARDSTSASVRTQGLARIYHAMVQYPEMVAGDGRFCTVFMNAFQGTAVSKLGADACYGIGVRASEQTARLGADGALGISVKIEDGNVKMLYAAVAEILEQLQIGNPKMRQGTADFHRPDILNPSGVVTGHTSHAFSVRRVV